MGNILSLIEDHAELILIVLIGILVVELLVAILKKGGRNTKRVTHNFTDSDEFYNELSVNGKDVFILVRAKNHIVTYVSKNVKDILGLMPELLLDDLWVLKRTMDRKTARKLEQGLKQWNRKDTINMELYVHNLDTKEGYWSNLEICLTEDQKYYLITLENIDQEYEMRQKMQAEIEEVYRIDESKTTFLSQMSHEIRTPMNGMLGMISLAKMNLEDPKEAGDYLEKAESLSQFLLSIINDILDMSRIESGKVELANEKVDIFAMAEKLRSMFQTTVEDKGIHFSMEVNDFTIRYIMGDELRIVQVLTNFLSNSSKFTKAGGEIGVTFRQMHIVEGKVNIMMRVKDTGKGMSQEFLSRIFNPFVQETATTAKEHGGSGLGMSIADNLVHLMGGEITVSSELDKGTEFTIFLELPIAEGDQTMPVAGERIGQDEEDENFSIENYKILLAEDNDINAIIAMKLLKARGAIVERAENGKVAVEKFAGNESGYYDVILMDIQMPEMNGWEATKTIRSLSREDAKAIPILALSADAFIEDKRKSAAMGMNGHVSKPIDFKELASVIRKCMDEK